MPDIPTPPRGMQTPDSPAYRHALEVVRRLREAGFVALLAGGCVRDLLRGIEPSDYDVATSARPEQVRELFGFRQSLAVGESFGVIIVLGPRIAGETVQVEVATFRAEGAYLDGRRPSRVEWCEPAADAERRDFTINGMFFDPLQGAVVDYVGGQADLNERIVRAIGDPRARMTEDKLRLLRAVRFAAVLDFALEPRTSEAVRQMAAELAVVSVERITQELKKMLLSTRRASAMQLCHEHHLLLQIFPELEQVPAPILSARLTQLGAADNPTFAASLAILLQDLPLESTRIARPGDGTLQGLGLRLKLSNQIADRLAWVVANRQSLDAPASLPLHQLKPLLAASGWLDLRTLLQARFARPASRPANPEAATLPVDPPDNPLPWLDAYLARHPADTLLPPPWLTGEDLIARGLRPGPNFKQLLTAARNRQLDEQLADRPAALRWLDDQLR